VDGGLLSSEERFAALDQGMKEILYLGNEVKNSWGTIATNDQFIKAKPKLMHGFTRALLKALRLVKQNREIAMDTMMKFSELDRELAARTYDGMIKTFTTNGVVDEETQKNDLDIVREVPQSHQGSAHRARLRFQLCKESRQRADASRMETLETFTGEALRASS
jgi:hypothetical protein